MVHVVFLVCDAGRDQPELPRRHACFQVVALAGRVAAALQQQVLAVTRAANADVEAFVRLIEDQHVGSLRLAQGVPIDTMLPLGLLILHAVEQGRVVGRPHDRSHALSGIGQYLPCAQVFDVQRVLPKARGVGGVGQQVAVRGSR